MVPAWDNRPIVEIAAQRVEFAILGPLQVWSGGREILVPRRKQRALLTLLLLHANEVVSQDRLIAALWEGSVPRTAVTALHGSVSQLRKLIGPGRLVTKAPGYLLQAGPDELDLARFGRLVAEARTATEPSARSAGLRAALALWRGRPLAEFEDAAFARAELDRLAELRLGVLEERVDADLELGRHLELIVELESLVAAHPYRERLRGQLMLALYRSGRQAESLAAYRSGRQALVEELGIDPSPDLQRLEQQILAQDEGLQPTPAPPARASRSHSPAHAPAPGLVRKTVTVLFCDVVGSTSLGERLDPEVMRRLISRYFEEARAALERHGGTVEKFIGDAVMAVFGLPELHEDDALRAVRAAVELRAALVPLNEELERDYGARIGVRIGINTGEVVAGEGQTLVTGDAVNVAARLEQAAAPGELLLGAATHRLVRDLVLAEPVEPLELKGKSGVAEAFRLVELLPDGSGLGRGLGTPFVGRAPELELLRSAYARARDERRCELVVVTGAAGIGKSRLVHEFVREVDAEALVLSGRSLSYGSGITYWPLREPVQQLAGDDPRAELAALLAEDAGAPEAIASAVGFAGGTPQSSEVSWAMRRLLEKVAAERPVVLVSDDLHWAEPAFLDLVDYLRGFLRGATVLILGTGRPEVLDMRPTWRELALQLEPLATDEAEELAVHLTAGDDRRARTRAVEIAEGNPLFLEQLVAAGGAEGSAVPPTILALLASRIDRLTPAARAIAIAAAIEGRQLHRGAVTALAPEELRADVTSHLLALVRQDILRPDESVFAGDDGFSFVHALVREAAYAAASKELRADLHERYAGWLEGVAGARAGEFEEILGYHLGEVHRLRTELGPLDARAQELGARAARLLGDAGRRALGRSDLHAARGLLERAVAASGPDGRERYEFDLAETLVLAGEIPRALELARGARSTAEELGDDAALARADVLLTYVMLFGAQSTAVEARAVAERAIAVLSPLEDDYWLARSWRLLGVAWNIESQAERLEEATRKALTHARSASDGRLESECILWLSACWALGPTPVDVALERCTELRASADTRLREAFVDFGYALVLGQAGHLVDARARIADARSFVRELGDELIYAGTGWIAGLLELWGGDLAAADDVLTEACALLRGMGDRGFLCTNAAVFAHVLCHEGRLGEAEELARESEDVGGADDIVNEIWWRIALAKVLALQGEHEQADALAREAVAHALRTDSPHYRGEAWLALADVLRLAGRDEDARAAATEAARFFEQKGATFRVAAALELAVVG